MVPEGGCQLWHGETNVNTLLLANDDSFFQEECFVASARSSVSGQFSSSSPASASDAENSLFETVRVYTGVFRRYSLSLSCFLLYFFLR